MNLTELARVLKITPQELRDLLPRLGFSVGQKAIKVDNRTAQNIIKNWSKYKKQIERENQEELEKTKVEAAIAAAGPKQITIGKFVVIKDFAAMTELPINILLAQLMKNGVFVSMNEKIDFDTAVIVGSDLGIEVEFTGEEEGAQPDQEEKKLEDVLAAEDDDNLEPRSPVIVVMGHVDHGKTKLLDAIRESDVVSQEAGGITQHIGAYQTRKNDRLVTFIDTPGHEAFTAMRSRGAKVADIAILVVAADDSVKPQTVEAFRIIEAANIPYLVAINKIDKEDANIDRVKQDLASQLNLTPEDWGGKTICVPISALKGEGVDKLLDLVLLLADTEAKNLQANPAAEATGTIIESHIDRGAGPIATILVQNGTLKVGDQLCFNNVIYGKVKALFNYSGKDILEAGPSVPAKMLGLKTLPEVGDMLSVGEGKRMKIRKMKAKGRETGASSTANVSESSDVKKFNVIIKSDVLGSAEAIEESLMKINSEKIKVKVLTKSLGNINEVDIKRAEDSGAVILGFNIKLPPATEEIIREKKVKAELFSVIYDLIKYVKEEMEKVVEPDIVRKELGEIKVLAVFRTESKAQIIGGKVSSGQAEKDCRVEVIKEGEIKTIGNLTQLQSGKQDVPSIERGQECGLKFEGKPVIEEGDLLRLYREETIKIVI